VPPAASGSTPPRRTTYWPHADELPLCGARFQRRRWIADGKIVTSAGLAERERVRDVLD
jgi:hypothetical protein